LTELIPEQAYRKGKKLLQSGIVFSEFGSRRRRSLKTHDLVMKGLVRASQEIETGSLTGTSNVNPLPESAQAGC
jgi:nicotinate phosphoribosyltransferase